ncbi:hypothetical protein RQP46_000305 [Phenoliferia psychrophenolica]
MGLMSELIANLPALPKRAEAWTCDAIDFFAVALSVTRLGNTFGKEAGPITQSITLTLLFRPLGAIVFGLLSDRYGRRWPMVANLVICAVLSLGTGFVQTFPQFLAVRSLFGIAMGGEQIRIWGQATGTALENMPVEARGLFSGILQQGYAVGYLIAAVINLYAVPHYNSWRVLFYIAAGITLAAAVIRAALPESQYFLDRRAAAAENGVITSSTQKSKVFIREAGHALRTHWVRCIFAILLMSGFNFYSHGSQDLYPTYIQKGKGLSPHLATVATIILEFKELGTEISPVAFRAVWPGVAYQIGNMVSSASAQIEATAGEKLKTSDGNPDYGQVSAILIGVVSGFIIIMTILGRESHAAHFEKGKAAFEQNAGFDEVVEGEKPVQKEDAEKGHLSEIEHASSSNMEKREVV